jgi:hypothetical protein
MKRKFITISVLIQGPKQPGNDIDVYLRPFVEELQLLWSKPDVHVWDEYKQKEFDLRALLFVTINDWPALSTLGKKIYISQGDDSNYTVLRNYTVVEPYIEKHMDFVRSENPRKNEAWITCHHMETFGDWLRKK